MWNEAICLETVSGLIGLEAGRLGRDSREDVPPCLECSLGDDATGRSLRSLLLRQSLRDGYGTVEDVPHDFVIRRGVCGQT